MCQADQKVAAENLERGPKAVGVQCLFHQTMGLTPPDGLALPETSQEAAETMHHPKDRG
jgi:hypothetical protein